MGVNPESCSVGGWGSVLIPEERCTRDGIRLGVLGFAEGSGGVSSVVSLLVD